MRKYFASGDRTTKDLFDFDLVRHCMNEAALFFFLTTRRFRRRQSTGTGSKSVTLADPLKDQDADLDFKEDAGTVTFVVPHIDVYGIASVSWQ